MLVSLHVKNMALIKEVEVEFGQGLNIMTGETGAGKSIVIGAVNIALGTGNFKDYVPEDAEYALVELIFETEKEMPKIMKSMNMISRCQSVYRGKRMCTELSPSHHAFVFAVCNRPGCSQDELADAICLNKSTVARALSYLEENSFVRREADASDKRVLRVFPTDKMLDILPEVKRVSMEWNTAICDGISEEELSTFTAVLEKIEARAREAWMGGDRP
jgi:DNA-binding MarR family transcriptional regulator